jgi:hypothetical protein
MYSTRPVIGVALPGRAVVVMAGTKADLVLYRIVCTIAVADAARIIFVFVGAIIITHNTGRATVKQWHN